MNDQVDEMQELGISDVRCKISIDSKLLESQIVKSRLNRASASLHFAMPL